MKKTIFITLLAMFVSVAAALGQESYTYTVTHTRTIPINWKPEEKGVQRYTVAVSPLRLVNNGLKFDFEYELPKPGHWVGTSLAVYAAPSRRNPGLFDWNHDGNNRYGSISGWDDYNRMWGIGTSAIFTNTFSRSGWYFSTGIVFEFFRVGRMENLYIPYKEDGLTFYDRGRALEAKSYFKPTAQFNFGKRFAVSQRCYFDLYVGVGLSYSFYRNDDRHTNGDYGWHYPRFDDMGGFAYRGLTPNGGFRFGMLLWDKQ